MIWPHSSLAQETGGNNLSVPTIFVPSVGVTATCTAGDDTVLPDPGQISTTFPGYWVQGEAVWQADCDIAADNTVSATAAWGDNLAGSASIKVGSPARVELGLLGDPTAFPAMTGFNVIKLQPELEDRYSAYGTSDGSGVASFPEVRVWNAGVTLNISGPTTESLAFTAELNATGRVVYGYNWRPTVAGTYTLTATVPTVTLVGTDLGTFDAHTTTITVAVADTSGGGGGGGSDGGGSNTVPVAVDDSFSVTQGTTASLAVLANDSDADGDTLTITAVGNPAQGTAAIATGATAISYTAPASYVGTDSFTYTITDGRNGTASATVTVTVTAGSGGGGGGGTTPTPTPTTTPPPPSGGGGGGGVPVPGQGYGGGSSLIDSTLDPLTDATLVNGEETLVASSADGRVKIAIPVKGLRQQGSIRVVANPVNLETALAHPLHHPVTGLLSIGDETYDLQVLDASGTAITSFDADLAVSVKIDPTAVDMNRVSVLRWDDDNSGWLKMPTSTGSDGTVTFTTNHLSLYSLFELPGIARTLQGGLNYVTFSGADGTTAEQFAAQFGTALQSMFRFNAQTQQLETYIPGAPVQVQTLTQLRTRDAVILRLAAGAEIKYEATAIVPGPSGMRQQQLQAGLNAVTATTARAMGPDEMFFALGNVIASVSKYDAATGTWRTWIPGGPAFANTLQTINPYDVVWAQVRSGYGQPSLDFMEAPAVGNATAGVLTASDDVTWAIRERDRDRLQVTSCDGDAACTQDQTQLQTRNQERQQLAACVPAGAGYAVLGRTITIGADGQTATVQVRLGIQAANGAPQLLTQQWMFQLATDGQWRMTNVPACPFS